MLKDIAGRKVFYVMATEQEYGPDLKQRFTPLITGVGPVEAAVGIAAALGVMRAEGNRPDLVVSLGSAGSRDLEQTSVYQVASVAYRDMDASALGFEKGVTPFLDLPPVIDIPLQVPGIPSASLSTGANIVSGSAYDGIAAQMVDMESFAVLRACQHYGLPSIGLRGISDGKDEVRHVDDWLEYLHIVDENLAKAVDRLEQAIADREIL